MAMTGMSFAMLSVLPPDLHPSLRGSLVAADLLALVAFAAASFKSAGSAAALVGAAVRFSSQAELVLLALQVRGGRGEGGRPGGEGGRCIKSSL